MATLVRVYGEGEGKAKNWKYPLFIRRHMRPTESCVAEQGARTHRQDAGVEQDMSDTDESNAVLLDEMYANFKLKTAYDKQGGTHTDRRLKNVPLSEEYLALAFVGVCGAVDNPQQDYRPLYASSQLLYPTAT